mmetsp:Transcript_32207/g.63766  ORF Transcript_32207/g.63766 Transcript_32207/m.63766 type:complete len:337 (+) Transcript_32207:40-1050(+)
MVPPRLPALGGIVNPVTDSSDAPPRAGPSESAADVTRRVICGGAAGMIAKTATAPLERIKMLAQTGEHSAGSSGIIRLYRDILSTEGVAGLWAGNGANLLRIFPAKGVVFASNDAYQRYLRRSVWGIADASVPSPGSLSFAAGGMAGITASACTYPLDFVRGRISGKMVDAATGTKHYTGIWNTVVLTVRDEGFLALYRGVTPTLIGAVPYEGIKFGTVGLLEQIVPPDAFSSKEVESSNSAKVWRKVLFGSVGGVMAGVITYPNDTVRRLLQMQGSRGTSDVFTGYWDCVRKTYVAHGIQRFYRGLGINLIRMAPNTAVQFGSYELLKQLTEKLI